MSKVAIVYWSGTGNTEAMAAAVAEGVKSKGADASILTAGEFNAAAVAEYDAIAFGCPAMGAEVLEEEEFDPMFTACEAALTTKRLLFSGLTAGATANGCVLGKTDANRTERCLRATALSAMKRPMNWHRMNAKHSGLRLRKFHLYFPKGC